MASPNEIFRIRKENFERAVNAIKIDDLDELKEVLKVLPEFNTMVGEHNRNLLHISCVLRSKKVFDYLLNLNCFDLEAVDDSKKTVLEEALCDREVLYWDELNKHIGGLLDTEYDFRVQLINAGADVYKICSSYNKTYLHYAIHYNLSEIAKLLLQKGADPNVQNKNGSIPLHFYSESLETLDLLLQYGADTAICDNRGYLPFDCAVLYETELPVLEHLFHCTFDCHSADYKIQSKAWIKLLNSPLFYNVMDIASEVIGEFEKISANFFVIQPDILKKIIEKCDYILEEVLSRKEPRRDMAMNIDNMEILLNCKLHFEMVQLISKLKLKRIFYANHKRMSKEELSNLILYLLSYGLNVTSYDCQEIYKSQGNCDFFQTMLLHLDYGNASHYEAPLANIIIDIHCDLNTIIGKFSYFSTYKLELLDFFANSQLRLLYERSGKSRLVKKVKQLPTVPSLLQLARDETRKHIVRRYNLQKTSQYYWVLRKLEIGTTYVEILSFKTKLYG